MLTGRLSAKNLIGPLGIAKVAYRFASLDTWEFIFFLGLISVNLAVVNFLPMPVLDGGHMVFLLYEKLRGKPASEGVRVATTYAGLVMILSLLLFVLWLDFTRLFL
jgi:regulator of sigma E protease